MELQNNNFLWVSGTLPAYGSLKFTLNHVWSGSMQDYILLTTL
jgi:hypothetical protein